jgi:hypothetical protein
VTRSIAAAVLVAITAVHLPVASAGPEASARDRIAQARSGTKRNPRVYYTHSPPHAPNLVVVARAIALDAAMRAAGLNRIAHAAAEVTPGAPGQLYTESELEARTQRTRIDPGAQLVPALREAWPEIGELGARTLAAQFSIETGAGSHCYNFNLGNHKAGAKEPHMYLRGVWEGVGRTDFERMRRDATFGELIREESATELRKSGHVVPPGKIVVLLDPPHPAARFRANATLELGVARFAALHRRIGERNEMYLSALRAGDSRSVARILGSPSVAYFTGNVDAYAQGMMNHRDIIDEGLGPPAL